MAQEEPKWLSVDERAAWMRLLGVLQLLPSALDSHMRKHAHLTLTEYYALAMLSDAPHNRIQTKQLAVFTNTTLSRLSRVISGLEDEGLLRRVPNEHDGRATDIELTEAGAARLVESAPEHVNFVRQVVFAPQGPDGVGELHRSMDAILNELDPHQQLHRDPLELQPSCSGGNPEESAR
ncbi:MULTISPECIES: MarR family winged helix-turn-helix transcriptional regulator [Gulosibacter]|uniref:MarR family winged helix-turn-helix transcriptional regulator n=1 Tax=Gulosibacter TaxID=256818 RepID=UPI000F6433B6|nr:MULTISPECIES: MarR family transcriptional regulator [Gulosibacter]